MGIRTRMALLAEENLISYERHAKWDAQVTVSYFTREGVHELKSALCVSLMGFKCC